MEAIFHFVFELFKIAVLGSFYTTLALILFIFLGKKYPEGPFSKSSKNKLEIWMVSGFIISILLFVFMFSYWGDHGLGDSARIPVGYGKEVNEINGINAYIEPAGYEFGGLPVKKFAKHNHFLIGETDASPVDKPYPYFFWNLKTGNLQLFPNKTELNNFLIRNNLSRQDEFKTFRENYNDYWNGWRFWLLP